MIRTRGHRERLPNSTRLAGNENGGVGSLWVVVLLLAAGLNFGGCQEEFAPPELISNLRILGMVSDPPELVPGESTVLRALVANPDGHDLSYQWQWCPFTKGINSYYECLDEEFGLPPEATALFDLGTEPEALLFYPGGAALLRSICEQLLELGEDLAEFIIMPDCQVGLDVTLRLVVSSQEMERIAVRPLFLYFDSPEAGRRNTNPVIESILLNDLPVAGDEIVEASPGQKLRWQVVVDESSMEPFMPGYTTDPSQMRREEIIFSFFTTAGELERPRSFANQTDFTLEEAGKNTLEVPRDAVPGSQIELFFVVRDQRGGMTWETRTVQIASQ